MILRLGFHLKFGEAACSNRASGPHFFLFLLHSIVQYLSLIFHLCNLTTLTDI